MNLKNTTERWGAVSVILHWIVAVLIIAAIIMGIWITRLDPEVALHRKIWATLMPLHKSVGLAALFFATVRLVWYLATPKTHLPPVLAPWERVAATIDHISLYALTLIVPVSGWASSSSVGAETKFFGLFTLPNLMEKNEDASRFYYDLHWIVAWITIGLLAVHIGAALWHHFLKKDRVLFNMLPVIKNPEGK
ncbi:MAG: cytochrome b [Sphingomonadales bacterium]|nr:cytochrome b [Sphingomonadales bacterium]